MDFITAKQIIEAENANRAIHIYPRKHLVRLDGYKLFKINAGTLSKYNYYKKTGFLCK